MSQIKTNIEFVKEEIKKTLNKCERNDDVTLIAVSKTVGVEQINEALDSGIENLGENKVQEVEKKYPNVSKKAIWHLIGTLQTNKVKYIIKTIDLNHSLDRIPLAKEIDKRAKENDLIMDCLVQVNISLEDSKHGLLAEDVEAFVKDVSFLDQLKGVVFVGIFVFTISYMLLFILNKIVPIRTKKDDELQGLDVKECGLEAYPEFKRAF